MRKSEQAEIQAKTTYKETMILINKAYVEAEDRAWEAYNKAIAPVEETRSKAMASVAKAYEEATIQTQKDYDKAVASAWKYFEEAKTQVLKAYDEAMTPVQKTHEEAMTPVEETYDEAIALADKVYNEGAALANKAYDEAMAEAKGKKIKEGEMSDIKDKVQRYVDWLIESEKFLGQLRLGATDAKEFFSLAATEMSNRGVSEKEIDGMLRGAMKEIITKHSLENV